MFKKLSYGMLILGLSIPFFAQAKTQCVMGSKDAALRCEVTFTQVPTFLPTMTSGTAQLGVYTIHNNTRTTIGLTDISLVANPLLDTLPGASAFINNVGVPNACGAALAPLASCNIRVVLAPFTVGVFSRTLHIGLNSRQCSLDSSVIGVAVTPAIEPELELLELSTFYNCIITSGANLRNTSPTTLVLGGVCSNSSINGFPPGVALAVHVNDAIANADFELAGDIATALAAECPGGFPLSGGVLTGIFNVPGTYCLTQNTTVMGTLTLVGGPYHFVGAPNSSISFAPGSQVVLTGGATPSSVFYLSSGPTPVIGSNSLLQGIYINNQSNLTIGSGVRIIGAVKNVGASLHIDQILASGG